MDNDQVYGQRVTWILRQTGLTPPQLRRQYVAYKDKREEFENGYGTARDMTALITPGVAAMLDLEEKMLADYIASQHAATARRLRFTPRIACVFAVLCVIVFMLAWLI